MTALPDPGRSRAVLIGASTYSHLEDLPAVHNNLTAFRDVLINPALGGLTAGKCRILKEPRSGLHVYRALVRDATAAEDTLLVYFAGHGRTGTRNELYLCLPNTNPDELSFTALAYEQLREAVASSRAAKKVVILDCCFSGRALADQAGYEETVVGQVGIEGTYILTATAANAVALAPPGERYTAFTGTLLDLLRTGIPGGPELLSFAAIYPRLRASLTSRQLPQPRQQGSDTIANLSLTRNRAYEEPAEAVQGWDRSAEIGPDIRITARSSAPERGGAEGLSFSVVDLARLYDFPADLDGTGQCVAVVELGGGYHQTDLDVYMEGLGFRAPKITAVSVDGASTMPRDPYGADGQVTLDLEVISAVVPRAEIVIYFAPNTERGFLRAVTAAAKGDTFDPSVLCISWGQSEAAWRREAITNMDKALATAAARGITVCCGAGNNGPTGGANDGRAHVDFPASSPHVLACGGTQITATEDSLIRNEVVWNDHSKGVTGGGFSEIFPVPAWQKDTFMSQSIRSGKLRGRGVPDVAANASPRSGYQVLQDGKWIVLGGTTAAAPLWAGLIARINQGLGQRVGFLNEVLYRNLGPAGVLRDITDGSTKEEKRAELGYQAGIGWDPCTGWGAPNGQRLLTALKVLQTTRQAERRSG